MAADRRILLEIIASSLDDARAAASGGADRFELCSALPLGGLTPSLGLLAAIKAELSPPVMFMVRPREGGMAYTDGEYGVMERDAALALETGADGLVFGFLTPEGLVDVARCRRFLASVRGAGRPELHLVFHRAFDVVADPRRALEELIDLGVTRVLTSGRAARASEGLEEIRCTVEQAAGRIEVLPGGGIPPQGVGELVARTGVDQVHLSLRGPAADLSTRANPQISFGADLPTSEQEYQVVQAERVRQVRQSLDAL
jgi:copper homeostasis protein